MDLAQAGVVPVRRGGEHRSLERQPLDAMTLEEVPQPFQVLDHAISAFPILGADFQKRRERIGGDRAGFELLEMGMEERGDFVPARGSYQFRPIRYRFAQRRQIREAVGIEMHSRCRQQERYLAGLRRGSHEIPKIAGGVWMGRLSSLGVRGFSQVTWSRIEVHRCGSLRADSRRPMGSRISTRRSAGARGGIRVDGIGGWPRAEAEWACGRLSGAFAGGASTRACRRGGAP